MIFALLESLPIAGIYIGVTLLILLSVEVGYRFGTRHQDKAAPTSLGPIVGGLLGMLGFVLAITFSMVSAQHDLRKQNVLDEANSIGTAYLRADLIEKHYGTEVKRLLREYVDVRLQAAGGGDIGTAMARSAELHKLLWAQVSSAAIENQGMNSSLMIQSVNDVIDMHEKRVVGGLRNRIPGSVWIALAAITMLTMVTMGIDVGFTGKRRMIAIIPLSLAFAMLVALVVDLNRPQSGLITVGQQSMVSLRSSMDPAN